jgi:hypothetical protein
MPNQTELAICPRCYRLSPLITVSAPSPDVARAFLATRAGASTPPDIARTWLAGTAPDVVLIAPHKWPRERKACRGGRNQPAVLTVGDGWVSSTVRSSVVWWVEEDAPRSRWG